MKDLTKEVILYVIFSVRKGVEWMWTSNGSKFLLFGGLRCQFLLENARKSSRIGFKGVFSPSRFQDRTVTAST